MESLKLTPPQGEKWKEGTIRDCVGVYNILAKLQKVASLPEGKTADDESLGDSVDIMNYAKRVLLNEDFWKTVPEDVPTRLPDLVVKRDDLKKQLFELTKKSIN